MNQIIPRELDVTARTRHCLATEVRTMDELLALAPSDLLKWPNFGRKSLNEVVHVLGELGLELAPERPVAEYKPVKEMPSVSEMLTFVRRIQSDLGRLNALILQIPHTDPGAEAVRVTRETLADPTISIPAPPGRADIRYESCEVCGELSDGA